MSENENSAWKHSKILLRDILAVLSLTFALNYTPYYPYIRKSMLHFLDGLLSLPPSIFICISLFIFTLIVLKYSLTVLLIKKYAYQMVLWLLAISCFLLFSPALPWITKEQYIQFVLCFLSLGIIAFRYRWLQLRRDILRKESIGLDDPLREPKDDKLNHAAFAENIFEVVKTLPENNARIAITGEWGCGKTTCLNFIESFAKRNNYPVVRFNPWKFNGREELWKGFISSIDTSMADWDNWPYGPFRRNRLAPHVFNFISKKLALHDIGQLFADLIISRLKPSFDITKEEVSVSLLDTLKGKKLVVLIDDLDRAPEGVIYQVLILIKEIIDVRGCVFICGIDLKIVQDKLESYNIKDGGLFLEKIFQLTFPVPIATPDYKKSLIVSLLGRLRPPIKDKIINKYEDLLPNNPRKLKTYFRLLSAFDGILLKRFGEEDLSWEFLYLAELLKIKYPERMELVQQEESFYERIDRGFLGRKNEEKAQTWKEIIKKKYTDEIDENNDFENIVDGLSEHGFKLGGRTKLYFKILSYVDPLTWKEYREWRKSSKENILKKLIDQKIPFLQRREFLLALMRERERLLGEEADEWNHDKREKLLEQAISIAKDCLWYINQAAIRDTAPYLLDYSLCAEWINLLKKWSHFDNRYYSEIREREKELSITLATQTTNLSSEILSKRDLFRVHTEPDRKFEETMEKIKDIYNSALSEKLMGSFEKEDAIKALLGKEHFWPEKNLLFKPNKYFYSADNKTKLHAFAEEAKRSRIVQGNFHEFLRMLFYAALDQDSSFEQGSSIELIKDDELRELFWTGAISARIQRRSMGDFLDSRRKIQEKIGKKDILAIPEWVRQEESDLLKGGE